MAGALRRIAVARWCLAISATGRVSADRVVVMSWCCMSGHVHLGCLVHEVLGREDVMVKPLGPLFEGVPGVAGATVTGDGRLALVLDLAALSQDDGRLLPSLKVSA